MLYIRPTENGYNAYNIYHRLLFTEENCRLLFAFIESDLSVATEKLHQYADSRIEPETLEPLEGKTTKKLCADIKKEMANIHPCLAANNYVTVFAMLAEHLNGILYRKLSDSLPGIGEYKALLHHMFQPLLVIDAEPLRPSITPTSNEFCEKYYRQLSSLYAGEAVSLYGLDYPKTVQTEAERYIYWILDQSSFRFQGMDRQTRLRLYSSIFHKDILKADMSFSSYFYWTEPEKYDYYAHTRQGQLMEQIFSNKTFDDRILESREQERREKMIGYLTQLHSDKQDLSDELKDFLTAETDKAASSNNPVMFEEYRADNLLQLIHLQLWLLTKSDLSLKRCKYCGQLFIAERQNADYCTRIIEGETEPCDIIGPRKSFARLMDADRVLKSYNRIYKTKYARVKRGSMSEEDWLIWKEEARTKLDRCRAGEVSEDEFETWLRADVRAWGTMNPEAKKTEPMKLGE